MRFDVIGVDGSKGHGCNLVTMMLGSSVLLDAGSATMLSDRQQQGIEMVLLTHSHLDHVLELGFLLDATVSFRDTPLRVAGSRACLEVVRRHYMNDLIWPDFSRIRTSSGPSLEYVELADGEWMDLPGGVSALTGPVSHGAGARGFLFSSGDGSLLYTGDTGPTGRIWEMGRSSPELHSVITEVSFPDRMSDLAMASDHLTPALLEDELRKLDREDVTVYAIHLKPWFRHEIERDLARRFSDGVTVLRSGDRLEI